MLVFERIATKQRKRDNKRYVKHARSWMKHESLAAGLWEQYVKVLSDCSLRLEEHPYENQCVLTNNPQFMVFRKLKPEKYLGVGTGTSYLGKEKALKPI